MAKRTNKKQLVGKIYQQLGLLQNRNKYPKYRKIAEAFHANLAVLEGEKKKAKGTKHTPKPKKTAATKRDAVTKRK